MGTKKKQALILYPKQKLRYQIPLLWAPLVCLRLESPELKEEEPPSLEPKLEQLFIALAPGLGQDPGPLGGAARPTLLVCW